MSVLVVLPTYNERENLSLMAGTLLALPLEGLRLLVVDDDSPDGTGRVADGLAAAEPARVAVLHRRGRKGLGLAYREGFRRALDEGASSIVQMDADFSHDPADVPRLVERLSTCDVAVGSRYAPGGSIDDLWSRGRRTLSRSANAYARTILRLRTRDATAGFKAWRREALAAVDLGRIRSNGYLFMVEMAYVCERLGLDVCEVPIHFSERRAGRSKMCLKAKTEAAAGIAGVWRRHHALH
ncbi:MAG TPA: polyprenol monophosphomannose synthase, partial [Candidatus Bathyarchaeia archaeon]|nr:polyprenol monophosphomannose synthase [Candidatus Bathyarchaeia archaeon]